MNEDAHNLFIVLNTLWLRRDCEQFRFFDQTLIDVLSNLHHLIKCQLSQKYMHEINHALIEIFEEMKQVHAAAIVNWEKSNKLKLRLDINVNDWLMRARKMRVLNTFLKLSTLSNTASLKFTDMKNIDFDYNWVRMTFNRLYELQTIDSFYERHIEDICAFENLLKIKIIHALITKTWELEEKTVFCIMSSINALILYWIDFNQREALSKIIFEINYNSIFDLSLRHLLLWFITD
jgi:hypothetical protein